ncbi:proton-translocating transhydrogenase family protein [Candidatus Hydrogenosomobacter endosymbioticus]|uniref:proton-translocating NAD(P)(+) transhydrogenase n=1 Tax=Candidatus Hydrogenosomobacter endosymbioticus TaxID=2558174 RepID=A0ABN6L2Q7_9PROT|nr:proton-translocating transhydrogenase family protein [Candidatus Hydrogenosomobacter endosymbioticus]BDB96009.1 hypothetical protein HYD_1420 [Candidatus Hydrogenosomobacter endosymbioticus]
MTVMFLCFSGVVPSSAASGYCDGVASYPVIILVLSVFLGYFVVSRVSGSLHAPLMSLTNAISSIIIVIAISSGIKYGNSADLRRSVSNIDNKEVQIANSKTTYEASDYIQDGKSSDYRKFDVDKKVSAWRASSIDSFSAVNMLSVFILGINVFGGFFITHRMISMFMPRKKSPRSASARNE